ncbi:hypothetical protein [Escherichia coli]|uniref:hypothetical protein n=1 Tax=Escherichia coli TaxID=562 RepID=UPI00215776A6|nr:hypothetical protein [Escherichia coli]
MNKVYFLDVALDHDGYRIVHTEDWNNFKSSDKGGCLGTFDSCVDAVGTAKYIYEKSKGCVFCCHLHD